MKNFIKVCFVAVLIVASSLAGIKIYNSYNQPADFSTPNTTLVTPPESFDLRDYIDIKVENQNPFGICYAFASLTSLETYLALNYGEYYDFSEIHFATSLYLKDNYYQSANAALTDGGNFAHFSLYTQKDNSLVLEKEMPMSNYIQLSSSYRESKLVSDFNAIDENFYSIVKVNDTKSYPQYAGNKSQYSSTELEYFRKQVKNHIMKYGSVTAGIHTGSSFTNATVSYRVTNDSLVTDQATITSNINHLISIIGWDDNYDANGVWENKGAYLCLNSWGTNFGYGGYFYVSYDDYFIESVIQGVTNATLATTNEKISVVTNYQDQTCIYNHVFNEPYPTVYTADILYTADHIGESITYIDSFIKGRSTKFYIQFYSTRDSALAGINTSYHSTSATKVDDYTLYTKYKLTSPLKITGNYMLVVREVDETTKTHSLCGYTSDNLGIETTYYQGDGLRNFLPSSNVWDPVVDDKELDCILPLIVHTDKQYVEVSAFESNINAVISGKYTKNNATFMNKPLNLTLTNSNLTESDLNNITITKLYTTDTIDVTSNFQFSINNSTITITMINDFSGNFTVGEYIITIPCNDTTIYRVIELQDVVTFKIDYYLDGGEADNPTVYTNKQTVLTLNSPTKTGYTFVGWYLDSEFTTPFDPSELPYTNISLYAKYDFATPTLFFKSSDISITYYDGLVVQISIVATHDLVNEYNTLSYRWYTKVNKTDPFVIVEGATSNKLTLSNVAQSGYYACEVSINITDITMTDSPRTKTLYVSNSNAIAVNIKPYIYDMSKVKWNYDEAFSYDTDIHTVELLNLPTGVTATYTNNSQSEINTYTAVATLNYDDMGGNAVASPVDNLNWEIRKAKITITINDIVSEEMLTQDELNSRYSCQIENEYLPEGVESLEDKIEYLNLQYTLTSSSNLYLKTISATTNSFDIYDITIVSGEYRVVVYSLNYNTINSISQKGFVQDCIFTASTQELNTNTTNLLKEENLDVVSSYNFSFSYLKNDKVTITIPIEHRQLLNNLCVYMVKNGQLTKLETSVSTQGLSFTTNEQNATYIIAHENYSHMTNTQMLILIIIIGVYVALFISAIVSSIKHKHARI